jgi:hypothetical protein
MLRAAGTEVAVKAAGAGERQKINKQVQRQFAYFFMASAL